MTPHDFSLLNPPDQEIIMHYKGTFISCRQEEQFLIDRYQLEDFCVEFFFNIDDGRKILIRCFTDCNELQSLPDGFNIKAPYEIISQILY